MGQATGSRKSRDRYWQLVSRFAAASVIATVLSQLVFVASYWLSTASVAATVLAWVAGAIPNFVLNRRIWGGGGREALRGEILRFGVISVSTALLAAFATSVAESFARTSFPLSHTAQVATVWAAFLGTYVAMFVVKFFLIDRLVFTAPAQQPQAH